MADITKGSGGSTGKTNTSSFIDFYSPMDKLGTKTEKYVDPTATTSVPQAEADLPIPYLSGRRRLDRPNTIYLGTPVTAKKTITRLEEPDPFAPVALFQKGNTVAPKFDQLVHGRVTTVHTSSQADDTGIETVEYLETTVDFAIGLCMGPGVKVLNLKDENDSLYFGSTSNIDQAMSGDGNEYTVNTLPDNSYVNFYSGSFTQDRDPTLTALEGVDKTPAYRGTSYMVFKRATVAATGLLASMSIELIRIPNLFALPDEIAFNEEYDAAIPSTIADLLCSKWGGIGLNSLFVNADSFIAAAETLAAEGIFASVLITSRANVKSILASLMDTAGGALRWNPKTAYIEFVLFREDYDILTIPHFNEDNVETVSGFDKTTWYSLPQAYQIVFNDRSTRYKATPVKVAVNKLAQEHAARTFSETYDFITIADVALKVIEREFGRYVAPFLSGDINTNRDGFKSMPGDVISLSWESFAGIVNFPMRIVSIKEKGTLLDTLTLQVQQASYSLKSTAFAAPQSEATEQTLNIGAPSDVQTFAVPAYIVNRRGGASIVSPLPANSNSAAGFAAFRIVGNAPNFAAEQYDFDAGRIYTLTDGATAATLGTLVDAIGINDGYEDGIIPLVTISGDLADLAPFPDKLLGDGLFKIGDEYFFYSSWNEITGGFEFTDVRRGLLDTVPAAHTMGAEVYFFDNYENVSKFGFDVTGGPYYGSVKGASGFNVSPTGFDTETTLPLRYNLPSPPANTMVDAAPGANAVPRPAAAVDVAQGGSYYVSWRERDKDSAGIVYREDASQSPAGVTYTVTLGADVLATGVTGTEAAVVIPALATLGAGVIEVKAVHANGDSLQSDFVNINVTT